MSESDWRGGPVVSKSAKGDGGGSAAAGERSRRLALALATSYVSKATSALFGALAIPIAVRSLSTSDFASLGTFSVVVMWTGLVNPAAGPALGVLIASKHAAGERAEVQSLVGAGIWTGIASAAVVALAMILLGPAVLHISGPLLISIAAATALFQNLSVTADITRCGFQRAHRNSLWSAGGNLLALGSIGLAGSFDLGLAGFIVAMYSVALAVRACSVVDLDGQWGFGHLVRSERCLTQAVAVARRNVFHLPVQIGTLMGFPLALVLFRRVDDQLAAQTFVAQTLGLLAVGLLAGGLEPLAAATADSVSRADPAWITATLRRLILVGASLSVVGVIGALVVGQPIAQAMFLDAAPSTTVLVLLACSTGLVTTFGSLYHLLVGLDLYRRAFLGVLPGYIAGSTMIVVGVVERSVELAVVGATLVPPIVSIAALSGVLRHALRSTEFT